MANEPGKQAETRRRDPSAHEVAEYLRRHPDFLVRHADLLTVLTPPSRRSGDTVIDMQRFMVERQRREIERLRAAQQDLIAVGRANLSSQSRIHAAVLCLLKSQTFEHLIDIVVNELAPTLGADAVTLCVESDGRLLPRSLRGSLFVLRPGEVAELIGSAHDVVLRNGRASGGETVFGPAAGLIRSDALMRLTIGAGAPAGLLAIGSRREDFFEPQQGTELLGFLARTVEHAIRSWLDLPLQPA